LSYTALRRPWHFCSGPKRTGFPPFTYVPPVPRALGQGFPLYPRCMLSLDRINTPPPPLPPPLPPFCLGDFARRVLSSEDPLKERYVLEDAAFNLFAKFSVGWRTARPPHESTPPPCPFYHWRAFFNRLKRLRVFFPSPPLVLEGRTCTLPPQTFRPRSGANAPNSELPRLFFFIIHLSFFPPFFFLYMILARVQPFAITFDWRSLFFRALSPDTLQFVFVL